MSDAPIAVAELARRIAGVVEDAEGLAALRVRGELSGVKRAASGHLYFTLKDEGAQIPCTMWSAQARRLRFSPEDGLAVIARGDVRYWKEAGKLQLTVADLAPDGEGAAAAALDALRRRLAAEGLFDDARKRPLPAFPRLVGVVTSRSGAVLHDLAVTLGRRAPSVRVLLVPVRVQGDGAADEVAAAIARLNALPDARRPDVLVVARGGGSAEDLAAFNEEAVVRALAASAIPTVSAVGHESDVTLADAAADVRAATPTAAAELVTADLLAAREQLDAWQERMAATMRLRVRHGHERLDALLRRGALAEPDRALAGKRQQLDELAGLLHSLSPLATLARGYAVARRPDGTVLVRAADARAGDALTVALADGEVDARVTGVRAKKEEPS